MRCILFCVLSGLKFLTKFTTEWGKWGYRSAFNFLGCAIMWRVPISMSFYAWVWIWYMAWLLGNTNINCHSVLAKLHPITFYRIAFLVSARFLGWLPLFVFFGLPIVSCDTRYLVFYNPSPPRMILSLDLLSEYRIQHGTNGPLYVTSSYWTWIFCRGVSGFATDCP